MARAFQSGAFQLGAWQGSIVIPIIIPDAIVKTELAGYFKGQSARFESAEWKRRREEEEIVLLLMARL
jgi:hypothetical protein